MNSEGHAKDCPILSDDNLPCVCGVIPVVRPPMTAGEMKHTAGPLVVFKFKLSGMFVVGKPENERTDAQGDGVAIVDTLADATLYAAASELLEALRGMLAATDHWNDWEPGAKERAAAQAAIAKATGSTP